MMAALPIQKQRQFIKKGALSQLVLGTKTGTNNAKVAGRTLLTNYDYDGTKTGANQVTNNLNLVKVNYTYTTDAKTKTDTTYARSLMALLGYNITNDENTNGLDLTNRVATIRQMGSVYHSNPVLLTQEGKVVAKKMMQVRFTLIQKVGKTMHYLVQHRV